AVRGAGIAGHHLVRHLLKRGAIVYLSGIHEDKLAGVKAEHPAGELVKPDGVIGLDVGNYCPCAPRATVSDTTLPLLKCSVIAGSANNPLAEEAKHGRLLMEKGILYAPDFLINAGGIINCAWERRGYNEKAAFAQTEEIYRTALGIFKRSQEENIPTYLAANQAAEQRIRSVRQAGLGF